MEGPPRRQSSRGPEWRCLTAVMRKQAALDFIHWLTIDKGFELATSMSYMPVDNNGMTEEQEQQIDDARVLKGIETGLKQSNSYQMVYGFDFENSYDVRTGVDACFSEALSQGTYGV